MSSGNTGTRHLQRLVDDLEETCNIGVLDGAEVIYVERVECDWPLRMQLQPGSRVPAYCTGIGKMLLASLDARTRRRLVENVFSKASRSGRSPGPINYLIT